MKHVEVTRRAEKDLRQLDKPTRQRIVRALYENLAAEPPPANADVKALQGAEPWLRLRIGVYRVLYRALTSDEMIALIDDDSSGEERLSEGYLVERVIHRRDLDLAVDGL